MPIYEYKCLDCGTLSEVLMQRGAKPPPCTQCGSQQVKKAFSTFAVASPACSAERQCENNGPAGGCPMSGHCRLTS